MRVIELLKEAKSLYLRETEGRDSVKFPGMCWCIKVIANKDKSRIEQSNKGHIPYASIVAQIPEFNPKFFNAPIPYLINPEQNIQVGLEFWWNIYDTRSRINAFDKLIELYKNSDTEFIW